MLNQLTQAHATAFKKASNQTLFLQKLSDQYKQSINDLNPEEKEIVEQIRSELKNPSNKKAVGYFNGVSTRVSTTLALPERGLEWLSSLKITRDSTALATKIIFASGTILLGVLGMNQVANIAGPNALAARLSVAVEIIDNVAAFTVSQIYNHAMRNFVIIAATSAAFNVLSSLEETSLHVPQKVDTKLAIIAITGHSIEILKTKQNSISK